MPANLPDYDAVIRPDWIDYNGHMNLAYYIVVFDQGLDAVFDALDIGIGYRRRTNTSTFAAETHTRYLREVTEGDAVRVTTRLLAADAKRLHWFQEMHHLESGQIAATLEQMNLHIDMSRRRVVPWQAAKLVELQTIARTDTRPIPPGVGRRITMPGN